MRKRKRGVKETPRSWLELSEGWGPAHVDTFNMRSQQVAQAELLKIESAERPRFGGRILRIISI